VNTPAAAIQGAAENLERSLGRLLECARELGNLGLSVENWNAFLDEVMIHAARTELRPTTPPLEARQTAKDLATSLEGRGVPDARRLARRLVDLDATESAFRLIGLTGPADVQPLVGCLQELVVLRRNALAIGTAIATINRIVSALRAYSHLDQTRVDRVNLHDGIETTLVILASRLKHEVTVTRRYAELPPVPIYVDELNQVWTNLISNAADAMEGKGEIVIETERLGEEVAIRITDRGAGIAPEILPRIFKPFFTTKPQGKGTGLGLGICRRIVEKHGGRIEAESEPGRTCFSVYLPVAGPPAYAERNAEGEAGMGGGPPHKGSEGEA
jgi:signal transduction histidine kinase